MDDRDYEFEDWDDSDRNFVVTILLCALVGVLGIHRFYVGKIGTGILMLLTGGGASIWWIIDLIMLATGNFRDKQGMYVRPA